MYRNLSAPSSHREYVRLRARPLVAMRGVVLRRHGLRGASRSSGRLGAGAACQTNEKKLNGHLRNDAVSLCTQCPGRRGGLDGPLEFGHMPLEEEVSATTWVQSTRGVGLR
eukprot:COSAG02_NODE_8069_length_2721_cov_4.047674_1_plen_111_part_00